MMFMISLLGSSVLMCSSLSDSVLISSGFAPSLILSSSLLKCTGVCCFFFNFNLTTFDVVLMSSSSLAKCSSLSEYYEV